MNLGLISLTYISTLLLLSHASPVEHHPHDILFTAKSDRNWFSWTWAWGTESTVTVVDRTPTVSFPSRPGVYLTLNWLRSDAH